MSTVRAPLGRAFWTVLTAGTVSGLGDGLRYTALPLLAASLTRDPVLVALVGVASYLPVALFGLLSGAVADRVERRRLLWSTDLARTVLAIAFAVIVLAGRTTIAVIVVVTFLLGSLGVFFDNTANTLPPMLVARDDITRANGLLFTGQTITEQFVGTALGGVLFAVAAALPFGIDAVSFGVSAVLLLVALPGRYRGSSDVPVTRLRTDIAEGLRWLWAHRLLRTLALLLGVINGATAAAEAVLVLYVLEVLREPQALYPLLLVSLAVGAVLGSVVAARLRAWLGWLPLTVGAAAVFAVLIGVLGLTTDVRVAFAAGALIGLASAIWNVVTISIRQTLVPARLLGRVTSSYRLVGMGVMPVGAALGGVLSRAYGLHAPYLAAAATMGAATLLALPALLQAHRAGDVDRVAA